MLNYINMKNPDKRQKKRGFTLMEAMFAVLLLATGLIAVGTVFFQQFSYINKLRELTIATLATQEVIERIRGMGFDTIITQDLNAKFNSNQDRPRALNTYLNNPVVEVTLDNYSYGDPNNIKRLSVAVRWVSTDGRTFQKSLVTVVARNGIDKQ